jgi:hypothetical protein
MWSQVMRRGGDVLGLAPPKGIGAKGAAVAAKNRSAIMPAKKGAIRAPSGMVL